MLKSRRRSKETCLDNKLPGRACETATIRPRMGANVLFHSVVTQKQMTLWTRTVWKPGQDSPGSSLLHLELQLDRSNG